MDPTSFPTNLADLTAEDLLRLRQVPEGWFIDYKLDNTDVAEWAKDISALANSEGGYLILGVDECVSKDSGAKQKYADKFIGVDRDDIPKRLDAIRQVVSAYLSPAPVVETRVFQGPSTDLDLWANRDILVVRVRKGTWTPYMHIKGTAFIRVADESRPVKDRSELDRLYERSRIEMNGLRSFLEWRPHLFTPQLPRAFFYFIPDPANRGKGNELSFKRFFHSLKAPKPSGVVHLPFDTVFASPGGYTARQVMNNTIAQDVMTIRWTHERRLVCELPFNLVDFSREKMSSHRNRQAFVDLLASKSTGSVKFVDTSAVVKAIFALCGLYQRLLAASGDDVRILLKAQFCNTAGTAPFFDSVHFVKDCRQFGIPMIRHNEFWCPEGLGIGDFIRPDEKERASPQMRLVAMAFSRHVLLHLGVIRDGSDIKMATRMLQDGIGQTLPKP